MAKNNQKTVESEEEIQEEREDYIASIIDDISDDVNQEFWDQPEAFGFTKKIGRNPTDKYNQAICDEISNRVLELTDIQFRGQQN